jgi:hypothetical protein
LTEEHQEHRALRTASPPPASESIHLPEPSYLPIVVAAGIAIALVGVISSWFVFAVGFLVAVVGIVMWIQKAREEMAELPLDHG